MKNITWHDASVTRARREALNGHKAANIWFTGLSGAGKSTIAHALEDALHRRGCRTMVLDGDNVRHGLCSDLGFTEHDRRENIRRIAEIAKLFVDAGIIVLTAFISPFRADRERVRELRGTGIDACVVQILGYLQATGISSTPAGGDTRRKAGEAG